MKDSKIYDPSLVQHRYHRIKKDLHRLLVDLHKGSLVFNYNGKVINARPADLVRVLSEWSQSNSLDTSIRNIVINSIVSSENRQIGSGVICAAALSSEGRDLLNLEVEVFKRRQYTEVESIYKSVDYLVGKGIVSKIVKKSVDLGIIGSETVDFGLTHSNNFIIQQHKSKRLHGCIHPLFEKYPSRIDGKLLFIDGIIESMGEIDNLLQQSAQTKENIVICAMGFSPDIVHTLYKNWEAQSLFVFPFEVNSWPSDGATSFAESLGAMCVSRDTGSITNLLNLDDITGVFSTMVEKNFLSIESDLGEDTRTEILLPGRYLPLMGVIEDRVRVCQLTCRGIAEKGLALNSQFIAALSSTGLSDVCVSNFSVYSGIAAARACERIINNMGIMIIIE